MPEPQKVTRQEILETALTLFTAQGYTSTSLRQIADRLGFSKAALYYHFPAKDLILIELCRPWLDALAALVALSAEEPATAQSADSRAVLLESYVDLLITHHRVIWMFTRDMSSLRHPDVGDRARGLVSALNDALCGPDADDSDRVRVACALGAVHAIGQLDPALAGRAREVVLHSAITVLQPLTEQSDGGEPAPPSHIR